MRAICEACTQPQPTAWQPGDMCIHCGQGVRHDVRCFWCTTWTPAARFCKSCGAECVDERHYGPARMLKAAGTDRFTVPRMLRELDPDQIENFSRIYQRQAVLVARHVDDLRWLERHLLHHAFSTALEEEFIPQLPWDERTVERYTPTEKPTGDDLAIARGLELTSQIPRIRDLAKLVRLQLGDDPVWESCLPLLRHRDEQVRNEAALVLSHWRVQTTCGVGEHARQLVYLLTGSPHRAHAAVRLATLSSTRTVLPEEALASHDPDVQFAVALINGDQDRLIAALDISDAHGIAAGRALIRLNVLAPLESLLRDGPETLQMALIDALTARTSAPRALMPATALNQVLMDVAEEATNPVIRKKAIGIVLRDLPSGCALRLLRAAPGDSSLYGTLMQSSTLNEHERADVLTHMMDSGKLSAESINQRESFFARIPLDFVPARFADATPERRKTLCAIAGRQLQALKDPAIHRFVVHILYSDLPPDVQDRARGDLNILASNNRNVPACAVLTLAPDSICRFFDSVESYVPKLIGALKRVLDHGDDTLLSHLSELLDKHDATIVPHLLADEETARALVDMLLAISDDEDLETLRYSATKFLGAIGHHPRWRDDVIAHLQDSLESNRNNLYMSDSLKHSLQILTGVRPR